MVTIGLTGGIATGKSTASAFLKELGARVWDADQVAHAIVEPGRAGWRAIRAAFGEVYFDREGRLLRDKLAQRIFDDEATRTRLNGLMHPAILEDMDDFLQQARADGVGVVIVDAPLLLESGADSRCDAVWVLSCGVDEQLSRLLLRGLQPQDAQKRIDAQLSDGERRRRANRVIDTSGSVEDTRRQLRALYEEALDGEL